jgi:hypothetical protein
MGRRIDPERARRTLEAAFADAVGRSASGEPARLSETVERALDLLFASRTQAFREALVGCCLARILDPEIDIRLPYADQADNAYSGRSLDENVVNPFLQRQQVPCSRGPFLSALRRNVRFEPETARGLRDRAAFEAMLVLIGELRKAEAGQAHALLVRLLERFVALRDRSAVILRRINRLSSEQALTVLKGFRSVPNGGLLPVLVTVAALRAASARFALGWRVDWQGINVADAAAGVGGDIAVHRGETLLLAVEVTEREIDGARVRATFQTKIARHGLTDYLFVHGSRLPTQDARDAAQAFFAQGHDVDFVELVAWLGPCSPCSARPGGACSWTNSSGCSMAGMFPRT